MCKTSFVTILFALACELVSHGQDLLSTGFKFGTHAVGYTTIASYDLSRQPISDQSLTGVELKSFPNLPGRQVKIHLWYPAQANNGTNNFNFEEYVWETVSDLDYAPMTPERKQLAIKEFIGSFDAVAGKTAQEAGFTMLLAAKTMAVKNAKPTESKFPVVIFPCWRSPTAESIIAEFLASHGYVVASTSLKGSWSNLPEISVRGITSQSQDLAYVIGELKKIPYADVSRIAMMGAGINATSCLALIASHPEIMGFVSLDGGILSESEKQMLIQTTNYDAVNFRLPMLFIYAPHPNISPVQGEVFKYCQRQFVKFPTMSEYYFLNYGIFEKLVPGIMGKTPGDVIQGNRWASQVVLSYLNSTLGGGANTVQQDVQNIPASFSTSYELKPALAVVPTLHELKVLLSTGSGEQLTTLYNNIKQTNPQPYSSKLMSDLFSWLGFNRDNDFKKREALLKVWLESMPNSSRGYFAAGRLAGARSEKSAAKENYLKAIELLEVDTDIFLDNLTRQRIKNIATQYISSN
ncbi:MAG TPA: hypothetical protein VG737_17175 [Cyclobacteriaceae bacterium]|nr:hypothetical protein [Cyclobacteriaceae bacterium]